MSIYNSRHFICIPRYKAVGSVSLGNTMQHSDSLSPYSRHPFLISPSGKAFFLQSQRVHSLRSLNRKISQSDRTNWMTRIEKQPRFLRTASRRPASRSNKRGAPPRLSPVRDATVPRGGLPRSREEEGERRQSLGLQCSPRNQRTECVLSRGGNWSGP